MPASAADATLDPTGGADSPGIPGPGSGSEDSAGSESAATTVAGAEDVPSSGSDVAAEALPAPIDLRALKRLVSERVRAIPGVSGIGLNREALQIYLETSSEAVKTSVRAAVNEAAADAPLRFVVTGHFRTR